uniref:Uncharacterized protein n=1 Tax=Chromera velia CCMP2878 TaxID=1169474 RepID=A0A0G4GKB6_9ALVE|eukprot:Cvel_22288.t1-p1 / transcript=Cvel_22288.t1 / gene=Cvel_22288 / organism=Chromera_velia_CCMP2878 / gene_product=hypothetical protein / transcript_product=hypothetical protein / location=Cvel_scaffold2176:28046-29783(-) / protein_length=181 / sequence_SO=supercontig / SO=protein_coding / is_pseudo=false
MDRALLGVLFSGIVSETHPLVALPAELQRYVLESSGAGRAGGRAGSVLSSIVGGSLANQDLEKVAQGGVSDLGMTLFHCCRVEDRHLRGAGAQWTGPCGDLISCMRAIDAVEKGRGLVWSCRFFSSCVQVRKTGPQDQVGDRLELVQQSALEGLKGYADVTVPNSGEFVFLLEAGGAKERT